MTLETLLNSGTLTWQLARFLLALVVGLLLTRVIVMPLVGMLISRRTDSPKTKASVENLAGILSGFIVFTTALQFGGFGGLVTVLGTVTAALTVAVGFGMRDEVASLVSGVFIQLDNPFVKGDYIKVNDTEGVVRDVNIRTTEMRTSGSEKLVMPNRIITANPLKNYTRGRKTKTSITVKVLAEKSEKARKILLEETGEKEQILDSPEPEIEIKGVEDGKAELELHYWIKDPGEVSNVRTAVLEEFNRKAGRQKIFRSDEKK
ncbi:MAG: mechanosensitive ion channel family protein [Candidatus Nanosalina sp.]